MSLVAVPDHLLKTRTDPEALAELAKRGLTSSPEQIARTKELHRLHKQRMMDSRR